MSHTLPLKQTLRLGFPFYFFPPFFGDTHTHPHRPCPGHHGGAALAVHGARCTSSCWARRYRHGPWPRKTIAEHTRSLLLILAFGGQALTNLGELRQVWIQTRRAGVVEHNPVLAACRVPAPSPLEDVPGCFALLPGKAISMKALDFTSSK